MRAHGEIYDILTEVKLEGRKRQTGKGVERKSRTFLYSSQVGWDTGILES